MNAGIKSGERYNEREDTGRRLDLPVPSRGVSEEALEAMKQRLLDQLLEATPEADLWEPVLHAANEAAALAWMTPFPLLVLPVLMEEKAQEARRWMHRQQAIVSRAPYRVLVMTPPAALPVYCC